MPLKRESMHGLPEGQDFTKCKSLIHRQTTHTSTHPWMRFRFSLAGLVCRALFKPDTRSFSIFHLTWRCRNATPPLLFFSTSFSFHYDYFVLVCIVVFCPSVHPSVRKVVLFTRLLLAVDLFFSSYPVLLSHSTGMLRLTLSPPSLLTARRGHRPPRRPPRAAHCPPHRHRLRPRRPWQPPRRRTPPPPSCAPRPPARPSPSSRPPASP